MQDTSYILSTTVTTELLTIENIRKKILIELVSPKDETAARFENHVNVIRSTLLLTGRSISNSEIVRILQSSKYTKENLEIIQIKSAYDFLRHFCYISGKPVSLEKISVLIKILDNGRKVDAEKLKAVTEFINFSKESGVVQCALCFALLYQILPEDSNSIKLSSIVSQAYSFNAGYDIRGMLNIQEFLFSDLKTLNSQLKDAKDRKNLSQFIEYFVQAYSIQAEKAYQMLKSRSTGSLIPPSYSALSERQIGILSLFDMPEAKVTNKTVQKEYKVSQITASRDLSKLAMLGLIYQKGRGRSVYYVRM
jgi:Fic family protein